MSIDDLMEGKRLPVPGKRHHQRRSHTVLLVEDCEAVANITAKVLRHVGYDVLSAQDSNEAIELYDLVGAIDLLVTDIVLPRSICGFELANILRKGQPDLPVIFFTGYPVDSVAKERGFSENTPLLMKPAMISEIRSAVAKALKN